MRSAVNAGMGSEMTDFGERARGLMREKDISLRELSRRTFYDKAHLSRVLNGHKPPGPTLAARLDEELGARGALNELATTARRSGRKASPKRPEMNFDYGSDGQVDEQEALELARRVAVSDVSNETLTRLEAVVDDLAIQYPVTDPGALLRRARQHLSYVATLLDGRKTLEEHRRLLVVGGWLSLIAATSHIDLKQDGAATARLRTAGSLAQHAKHDEIRAWCYETEAWRVLTVGRYQHAIDLSQAAQRLAPKGSSIAVQSLSQEGRAWARLGRQRETYDVIGRVATMVAPMRRPDTPEHHYRYDPDKSVAYMATTLAWLGDPAAESHAREVIGRLRPRGEGEKWPRRLASANIDLALTLLAVNRPDEACAAARNAMLSGRVVPSNYWRAREVVTAAETRSLPEAKELREAYEALPH